MLASRPVEVQGRFLGVAVTHEASWRFVAVHPSVCDIDGATFSSPAVAKRVAELVLTRGGGARHSRRPAEGPSAAEADLVPSDLVYAERTDETTSVRWSLSHRWVFFPRLRPDEALPIKCHDSAADGRAVLRRRRLRRPDLGAGRLAAREHRSAHADVLGAAAPGGRVTAVAAAALLEVFRASAPTWPAAEAAVPVLALLAGVAGAWLQAVHPRATAHEHDPALLALLVA